MKFDICIVHDRDKFCITVYALFSSSHLLPRVASC
jgi:hypothetical protein